MSIRRGEEDFLNMIRTVQARLDRLENQGERARRNDVRIGNFLISHNGTDITFKNLVTGVVTTGIGSGAGLVASGKAACTLALTTGTAAADIAGCTSGSLALQTGDVVEVIGVFDAEHTTSGVIMIGTLDINGVEQGAVAVMRAAVANDRATVVQQWRYAVPATASYTFKLQGRHSSGAPTGTFNLTHTNISWKVFR